MRGCRLTDRGEQRLRVGSADPHVLRTPTESSGERTGPGIGKGARGRAHVPYLLRKMVGKAHTNDVFPCGHILPLVRAASMKVNKKVCPICRAPIKTIAVNHHLKNLIEAHADQLRVELGQQPLQPELKNVSYRHTPQEQQRLRQFRAPKVSRRGASAVLVRRGRDICESTKCW